MHWLITVLDPSLFHFLFGNHPDWLGCTWANVAIAGGTLIANMVARNNTPSGGNTFSAQPGIQTPGSPEQVNVAYNASQGALKQQQDLVNAIHGQNGIQNQSNVYSQLQGVANGTGPNPAMAQLSNTTGQNVANQAALMAGQRGAGANVGLIARQAAMQGANTQQQAVGQGAALQGAQSLNALNQMGGIANNQASNQIGATGSLNQFNQAEQGQLLGNIQSQNSNAVNFQNASNATNAQMQQQQNSQNASLIGNLTGAVGSAAGLIGNSTGSGGGSAGATGGASNVARMSPNMYASGGNVGGGPRSKAAQYLSGNQIPVPMAEGGKVPALVSPGEKYLKPKDVQEVKQGKNPMQVGEKIPGKPKVSGAKNSYANDTVPKTLEEGGIVLPRSVTQAKDPSRKAAEFVAAILSRKGQGLK